MFRVFLGLGSNVGDRLGYLARAVDGLAAILHVSAESSVYETEPVGFKNQTDFLNMVVEGTSADKPRVLLRKLKVLEERSGRTRKNHMKPREIDVDILLYEGITYSDDRVTVPHPELEHRRFVLEPLAEIAPTVKHPVHGLTAGEMLRRCRDAGRVTRIGTVRPVRHERIS